MKTIITFLFYFWLGGLSVLYTDAYVKLGSKVSFELTVQLMEWPYYFTKYWLG